MIYGGVLVLRVSSRVERTLTLSVNFLMKRIL